MNSGTLVISVGCVGCGGNALRAARAAGHAEFKPPGSVVDLKGAFLFALLVTGVTIAATLVERAVGSAGVVIGAALAAFADVHAAAASVASVFAGGRVSQNTAELAVLACLTTNTFSKSVAAFGSGTRGYAVVVTGGVVLGLVVAWAGWALRALLG